MKSTTQDFYRLLHARRDAGGKKMTVAKLAAQIGSERCHVNKVIIGELGRGHFTRRKLRKVLTAEEVRALGWPEGDFHVEQSGNTARPANENHAS